MAGRAGAGRAGFPAHRVRVREPGAGRGGRQPSDRRCKRTYGKIVRLEERIKRSETRGGLELIRGTQTGFASAAYNWCRGDPLEDVIDEESSPGDFIRSCKQTIDLLQQLKGAAGDGELAGRLEDAMSGLNRGVVAYSGVS